jgi:hypothetical protein
VIDAAGQCGGVDSVLEIRTRRSFGQGLVGLFAGPYLVINIYKPWTGEVVCVGSRR